MSAEAATAAFDVIKSSMKGNGSEGKTKGKSQALKLTNYFSELL